MWESDVYSFLFGVEREIHILSNSQLNNPNIRIRLNELYTMKNNIIHMLRNRPNRKRSLENNERTDGRENRLK